MNDIQDDCKSDKSSTQDFLKSLKKLKEIDGNMNDDDNEIKEQDQISISLSQGTIMDYQNKLISNNEDNTDIENIEELIMNDDK